MKRWIVRIFTAMFAALVVVTSLAWLTVRASLPQLDGSIASEGISATVSITRDAAGIPTITAENRIDLGYALGFVHGQDRFFQMDLLRRDAAGELSAIIGAATVATDKRKRLHRFRARAENALNSLSVQELAVLQHYSMGVNAGLQSLDAKPFEYYLLNTEPQPWAAEDSLLVAYAMFLDLNDERASRDQQRGLIASVLSEEVLHWLDPPGTPWDAPLQGEAYPAVPIPGPELLSLREVAVASTSYGEAGPPPILGSNNWVVSGELTASGRAMVSSDMHLSLGVPSIFYRARLINTGAREFDVSGVSLPGQPVVIAGSNGRVAWGFTNSNGDWNDAVKVIPGTQANTYRTPDGELSFELHKELIAVKGGDPVEFNVRETIWGPIDDSAQYPDGEIAISWIAHHSETTNIGIMQLETVSTASEALAIANTIVMPPQNFVVGDANGDIGWTIAGQIPKRSDFDPGMPADWSEEHGWQGWIDPADYPRITNPESGRIWTANARVVEGEALRVVGDSGYAFGARARQIRDELFVKEQFVPLDMLHIQNDDRALFLAQWQELLLDVLSSDDDLEPQLLEYRRLIEDWIPRAVPESVGYRLVRAFRVQMRNRMFAALMTPVRDEYGNDVPLRMSRQFDAPLWSLVTQQPEHLLPAGFASWNDFMLAAVRGAVEDYEQGAGGTLADRSWGEYNTASIRHPLSSVLPMFSSWLDMPAEPLRGDADMPRAQGRNWGASERFSVLPGDEENSLLQMPGGQSGHPMSAFYSRGHAAWVNGEPAPFLPGQAQYELILQPVSR